VLNVIIHSDEAQKTKLITKLFFLNRVLAQILYELFSCSSCAHV